MPRYLSSRAAIFISSAVIQSGISVYESIALMVMHIPDISLSQFVSWLCLDSKYVMNSCDPVLCIILMLY